MTAPDPERDGQEMRGPVDPLHDPDVRDPEISDPDVGEPDVGEPVDVDAPVPDGVHTGRWQGTEGPVIAAVALGGVVGALARYGAGVAWPTAEDAFPWTTFGINVVGCALIGVLLVVITERFRPHRLLRPLLATGVLGGFTTFSTYAVDAQHLLTTGHAGTALLYLAGTVAAAMAAVTAGTRLTRLVVRRAAP